MACDYYYCQKQVTNTEKCNDCGVNSYCSGHCRAEDWKTSHQYFCPASNTITLSCFQELPQSQAKSLGEGSFGKVKLVVHAKSGKLFALKVIPKRHLAPPAQLRTALNEIELQKRLKHPNIITLYFHFEDEEALYLLLEYAEHASLFGKLRFGHGMNEKEAWKYFTQTCIGIKYLHGNNIIHRDLKPENLLLDKQDNIKICDFGWSIQSLVPRTTFCGTPDYMAPEIISKTGHSFQVDIWALGVLLYELLHGHAPFSGIRPTETFSHILRHELSFKKTISMEAQDLINRLLRNDPEDRLNIEGILTHEWVSNKCPLFDYSLGRQVTHRTYGPGVIHSVEGLICTVKFQGQLKGLTIPDFYREVQLKRAPPRITLTIQEDLLMNSLKEYCEGKPNKQNLNSSMLDLDHEFLPANDVKRPASVTELAKEAQLPPPPQDTGILTLFECEEIEAFWSTRNPLASRAMATNPVRPSCKKSNFAIDVSSTMQSNRLSQNYNSVGSEQVSTKSTGRRVSHYSETIRPSIKHPSSWFLRFFSCGDRK